MDSKSYISHLEELKQSDSAKYDKELKEMRKYMKSLEDSVTTDKYVNLLIQNHSLLREKMLRKIVLFITGLNITENEAKNYIELLLEYSHNMIKDIKKIRLTRSINNENDDGTVVDNLIFLFNNK